MSDIEDGEISDDDIPTLINKASKIRNCLESSANDVNTGPSTKKKKPNNIWTSFIQEDTLTSTMNSIGVGKSDLKIDRNVESYSYSRTFTDDRPRVSLTPPVEDPLAFLYDNDEESDSDKEEDSKDSSSKDEQEEEEEEEEAKNENHPKPKNRKHKKKKNKGFRKLKITHSNKTIVSSIARDLKEPKIALIWKIVQVLGKKKALDIFYKTEEIERNGGMMILSGQRRRTAGGLFLHLTRSDESCDKEAMRKIFGDEDARFENRKKNRKRKNQEMETEMIEEAKSENLSSDVVDVDLGD